MTQEQFIRWRLILGKSANDDLQDLAKGQGCLQGDSLLSSDGIAMDDALELIYSGDVAQDFDISKEEWSRDPTAKHGAVKGRTFPRVARWLGEIRRLFPKDVV